MKKIGCLVNPYAGTGGAVALKGSDGSEILEKALSLGAELKSPQRAARALELLEPLRGEVEILTCAGDMGETEAAACGFQPTVIYRPDGDARTTAEDTKKAARILMEQGIELLLFAGGDGTARDICDVIGTDVPVVGIPTGTKMHSGVYATTPAAAGNLAVRFLSGSVRKTANLEVMDIDEEAFRQERVKAKLFGYMQVPDIPELVQGAKGGGHMPNEAQVLRSIAEDITSHMEEDVYYIIGSGTTIREVMTALGLPDTLLGVDIVRNRKLIAADVSEKQILEIIGDAPAKIVVTVIGGQGFIFGRGNQQISWRVIEKVGKKNIIVAATEAKLSSIPGCKLRVDTGSAETDRMLAGPMRVCAGAYGQIVMQVACDD